MKGNTKPYKKNKISLIVLNYNGKHLLKDYFNSVFSQSLIPDEIIMFDNLCKDGSRNFVEKNYPKVKIISEDRYNTGTALAVNTAVSHASGEFIILQMNDIALHRNCIKELYQTIRKNPYIGIVSSVCIREENRKKGNFVVDHAGGFLDIFGCAFPNHSQVNIKNIPETGEVLISYGDSFIFRKRAFDLIGGLDTRMFMMNDDIDFSWRIRLSGYKILYTKKSIIYHKGSVTIKALYDRPQIRYWSERNSIRTYLKNITFWHFIKTIAFYIAILAGEMCYFLYRLKFALFLSDLYAILWNLFYLPEIFLLRYKFSKNKKANIDSLFIKTSFKLSLFKAYSKSV